MNSSLNMEDVDINLRPDVKLGGNHRENLDALQLEIEKYSKECELLKLKTEFKKQLLAYKRADNMTIHKKIINYLCSSNPSSLMLSSHASSSLASPMLPVLIKEVAKR